ncbi:MAG: hypothetical protein ACYC3I_07260 [Gemmataceae bacterium]
MTFSGRVLLVVVVLTACFPSIAQAGMPSITLTDLARLRVQSISFFLAALLLSSWLVQLLWNYLRRDFSFLPRLGYGKALGAVILWGLLFVLVLTMISGARELMTPGAWEKQGATYRLSQQPAAEPRPMEREQERRESLDRLRIALWQYAEAHQGRFPISIPESGIAEDLWLVPGPSHPRYLYVGGLTADRGSVPLVYEPGDFGDPRLVLLTNGSIETRDVEEILASLPPEGR